MANVTAAAHPPAMMGIKVHSGNYEFDDNRDFEFLKLLADEIQDDHVMVITEGLQIQKTLASSFPVVVAADSDMTEEASDDKAAVAPLRSGLQLVDSPMIVAYSDSDEDNSDEKLGEKIAAGDDDYDDMPLLIDGSEDKKFAPKSEVTGSGNSVPKSETGSGNSFVNAVFDDFTPKDEIWTFCELCGVVQDNQRTLIKIHGCGHTFCNYCFEWQSVSQLGPEPGPEDGSISVMIKCPVESCFNEIQYDTCVALLLQHTLDYSSKAAATAAGVQSSSSGNISDNWEFLDDDLT